MSRSITLRTIATTGTSTCRRIWSGSGRRRTLHQVAQELARRVGAIFLRGSDGRRPVLGDVPLFQDDPHWRDLVPFHEYFHGDTGRGCGASHQTGWTGLVADLLIRYADQFGEGPADG